MDDETECKLLIVGYILAVLLWWGVKIAAVGFLTNERKKLWKRKKM